MKRFIVVLFLITAAVCSEAADRVILADNSKTDYKIVFHGTPNKEEKAAVADLHTFLKLISGADFQANSNKKHTIWIGKKAPSDAAPLLENERRIRIEARDLYICGQGECGNVNAIYDLLRDAFGCRWFTFYGVNRIPKQKTLSLPAGFSHSVVPSIAYMTVNGDYHSPAAEKFARRNFLRDQTADSIGISGTHAGQRIIPSGLIPFGGKVGNISGPLKYFKDKAYFQTNPEYFAMNSKGQRVTTLQLCYTNAGLRDKFEKNIRIMLAAENYSGGMKIIGVGQDDNNGAFCYCANCIEAMKKHDHPAGAYYDFLYDLSGRFEKTHPDLLFCFLAYRKNQTLMPSKLLTRLPGNLLPSYAPLGVDFTKPINHPVNAVAERNFAAWAAISSKMHWWAYPTPYPRPIISYPLIANINRIAGNFRLAHRNKVWMAYCQFGSGPYNNFGFNDLRVYMLSVLCRDINADVQTIIREFTDHCYGEAASDMRAYLAELEQLEINHRNDLRWNPSILSVKYATAENLLRWQKLFDKMEHSVGKSSLRLLALRRARFSLDETTIAAWQYMTPAQQAAFGDLEKIISRAVDTVQQDAENSLASLKKTKPGRYKKIVNAKIARVMSGLEQYIAAARGGKPLPEYFAGKKVFRIMPDRNKRGLDRDPEAAFGLCNTGVVPKTGSWFYYRSYKRDRPVQWIIKRLPRPVNLTRVMKQDKYREYQFYHLGRITLEADSMIAFNHISRGSSYAVGHLFDPDDPDRLFDLYVSMAVDPEKKIIRQDQLVLVKLDARDINKSKFRKTEEIADQQDMFQ